VARLTPAIRDSGNAATPLAPLIRSESPESTAAIAQIREAQGEVMAALRADELDKAAELQGKLRGHGAGADPVVARPDDRQLGGYHLKNAYLVEHWDAIQAGRAPKGPLLDRSERRFFETLSICPTDPSALNSLGNILFFERDLDAAEFFHLTAIAAAHERGMASYPEAEQDLALVRRYQLRVPSQPVDPGVDPGVV
jgi:hypothetical protein